MKFFLLALLAHPLPAIEVPSREESVVRMGSYGQDELPTNLGVLVWNTAKGRSERWREEFAALADRRDLMLLQEMIAGPSIPAPELPFGAHMATSFLYNSQATGVALFSKAAPLDFDFRRSLDLELGMFTPKTSAFARFALAGRREPLLAITIHSLLMVDFTSYKRQLQDLAPILQEHQGPIIFAGDFNTWSKSRLAFLRDYSASHGLKEVAFENESDKTPAAFTGLPLDHIFVRGLQVGQARVVRVRHSDHHALRVNLSSPENPSFFPAPFPN